MIIRLARLLLISIPLVAALALLMLSPSRFYNSPERYCLRLNDTLVDPLSGATLETSLPTPISSPSPNGRFDIVRKYAADGESHTVVLIDHTNGDEILIGQHAERVYWSANSTHYAFMWAEAPYTRAINLTVGNVTDGKRQTTVVETSSEDTTIQLRGLSADGQYATVTLRQVSGSEVILYTISDLSSTRIPIGTDEINMVDWSQTGHMVGLIGRSAMKPTIAHVLSADMSWHVAYEIVRYSQFTNFIWSPDATHVVIQSGEYYRPWVDLISHNGVLAEFAGSVASSP
jgi:hypothetical protein